jgi:hypothetical protein
MACMLDGPSIALVGCGASKLTRRAPAQDLYTGTLFRAARAYAEQHDHWYILSARHGLVDPEMELDPYDCSLSDMSERERDAWGDSVVREMIAQWGEVDRVEWVLLAGVVYTRPIRGQLVQIACGHRQDVQAAWRQPVAPLTRLGIGLQKQWLTREAQR